MKKNLQKQVLQEFLLYKNTTRKDLVKKFNLRPATLYAIIDKLNSLDIICEPSRTGKKPGRKASNLYLNKNHGYFIGVELAPKKLLGSIVNLYGDTLKTTQAPFDPDDNQDKLIENVLNFYSDLLKHIDTQKLKGIGFADPGIIDIKQQRSVLAVNIKNWKNIDTKNILVKQFNIQNTIIESSVNTRTFAEHSLNPKECSDNFFNIELAYGVGGGFIQNGELFHGGMNHGMEIGHLIIEPNGHLCQCGNKGCLEAYVSTNAIRRKIEHCNNHGVHSILSNQEFSMQHFIKAVKAKDKSAITIAEELALSTAKALQAIVALINPKVIMLSGELTGIGDNLTTTIKKFLELNCQPIATKELSIKISSIDTYGASLGAALIARKEYLLKHLS